MDHRIVLASACVLTSILALPARALEVEVNRSQDVEALTAIETAVGSSTSVDEVMRHIADDAVFADLTLPDWFVGVAQIRAGLAPQLDGLKDLRFRITDKDIITDGTYGCVALQIHVDVKTKTDTPISVSFRELDAFHKKGGHWQWVAQQVSFPLDPATGMAVADGPPIKAAVEGRASLNLDPAVAPAMARSELERWLSGILGETSLGGVAKHYDAGGPRVIYGPVLPGKYTGPSAPQEAYGAQFDGVHELTNRPSHTAIFTDGSFGVVTARIDQTRVVANGTKHISVLRQTDCLRRDHGQWYPVYEMVSHVFDKATGKPATP